MALTLEIVTPQARVYSDTIDTVVIPTTAGEIGVLAGHVSLVSQIAEGELRVTKDGKPLVLAVGGGFVQIDNDKVSVLAEQAITIDKIDVTAVEAALKRAQEQLKDAAALDPAEQEHLHSLVRFAGVQLNLKSRGR
ncbi:MAG TPA: ATP synthase F1 subunit epsilon [Rariglobus sp.]|jgi:F-type H+-transporting ATPase subunit epsilon|nr:ATP synthase F1 subunit epsilon [Rariglobus sp.]